MRGLVSTPFPLGRGWKAGLSLALLALWAIAPSFAEPKAKPVIGPPSPWDRAHWPVDSFVAGQVVVKYPDTASIPSLATLQGQLPAALGLHGMQRHQTVDGLVTLLVSGDVLAAIPQVAKLPGVQYAEPNALRYLTKAPDDPYFGQQRNMVMSRARNGWEIRTDASAVLVGIVDTGIDFDHPDLVGNIQPGASTDPALNPRENNDETDTAPARDDSGHGTMVAGVIGATGNNNQFVAGAAWRARLLPLRACGTAALSCSTNDIAAAIDIAIARGARVLNLSLGGYNVVNTERDAVARAVDAGLLVVAASGNGTGGEGQLGKFGDPDLELKIFYPAGYPGVIGVGSCDAVPDPENLAFVQRSRFSNYGDMTDVVAVGKDVTSTAPSTTVPTPIFDPGYETLKVGQSNGTSFATPLVTGLGALIMAQFPDLTGPEVHDLLIETARPLGTVGPSGRNDEFGFGLVDFVNALSIQGGRIDGVFAVSVSANPIFPSTVFVSVKLLGPLEGAENPVTVVATITQGSDVREVPVTPSRLGSDPNILIGKFLTDGPATIEIKVRGTRQGSGELSELTINYEKEI